jgi:hypothetical protein
MTSIPDLAALDGSRFQALCVKLLRAEGFAVRELRGLSRDVGFDAELLSSEMRTVAEFKHSRQVVLTVGELRRLVVRVEDARSFIGAERGLLLISSLLPPGFDSSWFPESVVVWDRSTILDKLRNHPEAATESPPKRRRPRSEVRKERALELERRLENLQPGRPQWRAYEDLCVEILNFSFIPPLRAPSIQTRSEDGLDRRDALYPISRGHRIWDQLRAECQTRFLVAEFKNFADPPGQTEVESLQQYLFPKAMRSFGLLCSRALPSRSAELARRRAWMEGAKLIVMLSDRELRLLLRIRAEGGEPADVIEDQLDNFFADLSP